MSENQKVNINNNEANVMIKSQQEIVLYAFVSSCLLQNLEQFRCIFSYIFSNLLYHLHHCCSCENSLKPNNLPVKSIWLYCTLHSKHDTEHNEPQLLHLYFLHENQIDYQMWVMWHSKEMLLLKEQWSSSLVQRFLPPLQLITACRDC